LQSKQVHAAIAALKRALAINNENSKAHFDLSRALIESGDKDAAVFELREVLRIIPGEEETTKLLEQMTGSDSSAESAEDESAPQQAATFESDEQGKKQGGWLKGLFGKK